VFNCADVDARLQAKRVRSALELPNTRIAETAGVLGRRGWFVRQILSQPGNVQKEIK
jgi:hypothetical protein